MSDDLLSGQSVDRTLSQLMRRGLRGRFSGLDALRARLRQARRHEQEQLNLEGPLREIQERLAEILADNVPMQRLSRKLGFEICIDPEDPRVVQAVIDL